MPRIGQLRYAVKLLGLLINKYVTTQQNNTKKS